MGMPEDSAKDAPAEEVNVEKPAKSGCLMKVLTAVLILMAVLALVAFAMDSLAKDRAEEVLHEAEQILAGIEVPVIPADENGAILYGQALGSMVGNVRRANQLASQLESGTLALDSAQISKLLADNRNCLATAMQAYRKPRCAFIIDYNLGYSAPIPSFVKVQAVAQMLMLSARRAAAEGRGKEAAERLGAVLKLSSGIARGRILICHMVGATCAKIGAKAICDIITDGRADEAFLSTMAGILDAHEANRPRLIDSLEVERAISMLSVARKVALKPLPQSGGLGDTPLRIRIYRGCGITSRDADTCDRHWDAMLECAAKPYPQAYEGSLALQNDSERQQRIRNLHFPYNMIMIEVAASVRADAECLAFMRATRGAVMVQQQKLTNGSYPDSALNSLPTDPFTAKPLLYRKTDSGFVIYSVGSNGRKDDGGKNMFGNRLAPDVVFAVDPAARKANFDAERKKTQLRKKKGATAF